MQEADGWFGAEGERRGYVTLTRGRHPEMVLHRQQEFPHMLCAVWNYLNSEPSALPTSEQYQAVRRFESGAIDKLEDLDGILTFSETGEFKVRYFLYTHSPQLLADKLQDLAGDEFNLEFFAEHDPNWRHYTRLIARLEIDK